MQGKLNNDGRLQHEKKTDLDDQGNASTNLANQVIRTLTASARGGSGIMDWATQEKWM